MELVLISGMSGAGKSRAAAVLEDAGFYCIDNMPLSLIPKFAEICFQAGGKIEKVALVTDVRGMNASEDFYDSLSELKNAGYPFKLLFLDANSETLISRYKETRRKHPLSGRFHGSVAQAIDYERELMQKMRDCADYVVDTSRLSPTQLKEQLVGLFVEGGQKSLMFVSVVSFGFKYGAPADADLLFDVRCLPNPYYVLELKDKTGLDSEVYDYVFSFEDANTFFDKLADLVRFLIPLYIEEGKASLVIGIGCTGGKHRSVSFAQRLNAFINESGLAHSVVTHKDIGKK